MNNCLINSLMYIFTAMSGIGACFAVVVSIVIYKRQKKIALYERRVKILNDFEMFVYKILPSWEWDGSVTLITKYAQDEVTSLFSDEYANLQKEILDTAEKCNILIGDMKYAEAHGECHGKDEITIQREIQEKIDILFKRFTGARGKAYKRWLKL